MNVGDILHQYLKENGYDGFYHPNGCSCWGVGGDDTLMTCVGTPWHSPLECEPGYHYEADDGDEWIIPDRRKRDDGGG